MSKPSKTPTAIITRWHRGDAGSDWTGASSPARHDCGFHQVRSGDGILLGRGASPNTTNGSPLCATLRGKQWQPREDKEQVLLGCHGFINISRLLGTIPCLMLAKPAMHIGWAGQTLSFGTFGRGIGEEPAISYMRGMRRLPNKVDR